MDFRDYSVHIGNNQSFRVFPEDNSKGDFYIAVNVIVHPQVTYKNYSFSGECSHPGIIIVCDITHILTKVMSFAFFIASLLVCVYG